MKQVDTLVKKVNFRKKRETKYISKKFRTYINLIRPFTLLAPFIGGICGGLMALGSMGVLRTPEISLTYPYLRLGFNHLKLIHGAVTIAILNAASNALNQVYDSDIDAINKPERPIPAGKLTAREGLTIAWGLYIFTIMRAMMINFVFTVLVVVLVIFTIVYSIPPLRLKKRLWISNIAIGLSRGLIGIVAAWSIFGNIWDPVPWVAGTVMAIFLVGAATTKDYTDIKGDRAYGMNTLPIKYGINRSINIIAPFFVIPFLLVPLATFEIVGVTLLPTAAQAICLFIIWGIYIIHLLRKEGRKRDTHFENSPVWVHMYLMLIGFQVSFAAAMIFSF